MWKWDWSQPPLYKSCTCIWLHSLLKKVGWCEVNNAFYLKGKRNLEENTFSLMLKRMNKFVALGFSWLCQPCSGLSANCISQMEKQFTTSTCTWRWIICLLFNSQKKTHRHIKIFHNISYPVCVRSTVNCFWKIVFFFPGCSLY